MLFDMSWTIVLTAVLGVFFLADGVVSAFGPAPMRESFIRWGFPRWWHLVNAAVCLTVGVLLFIPDLRWAGLVLGGMECLAIFATLIWNKQPAHLPPSVVLLILICVTYWGLYGATLGSGAR